MTTPEGLLSGRGLVLAYLDERHKDLTGAKRDPEGDELSGRDIVIDHLNKRFAAFTSATDSGPAGAAPQPQPQTPGLTLSRSLAPRIPTNGPRQE